MKVYGFRVMLVFVMYYIYVTSGSSLLIESTDFMIIDEVNSKIRVRVGATLLLVIITNVYNISMEYRNSGNFRCIGIIRGCPEPRKLKT